MKFYGFPYKLRGILWKPKDTPWNSMELPEAAARPVKFFGETENFFYERQQSHPFPVIFEKHI